MAAMEVPTEALGDDGDTMEVCSEHVTPPPEPVGEKRTYRHRSVAGISEVVNVLGEKDAGSTVGFCGSWESGCFDSRGRLRASGSVRWEALQRRNAECCPLFLLCFFATRC